MIDWTIYLGDAFATLRVIADNSINCCVTSPPYFGLRDYGVDGQMGLEETPDAYVAGMVAVFREVRRVLRPDGTLWLNIGDSYTSGGRTWRDADAKNQGRAMSYRAPTPDGLKPKDLIGIPWRLAFALQADGWWLRQEIIWHKPNPMPESVKDRCTKAHEQVFLLAKSERYYFDTAAIAEPATGKNYHDLTGGRYAAPGQLAHTGSRQNDERPTDGLRNRRSVWTIPTHPFPEAHFATFPDALVEPCILAGCPPGGTVLDPFAGSGTTGAVARRLGRGFVGIELNPEYHAMALRRINASDCGLI